MTTPVVALGLPESSVVNDDASQSTLKLFGQPYNNYTPVSVEPPLDRILESPTKFAKSLDSEFCVTLETPDRLLLISDRFVSRPLFYVVHGVQFVYTFSYSKMWHWLHEHGELRPDKHAVFEFLKFQRLFGDKTLDQSSKMLPPATVLIFDKRTQQITQERYWSPGFEKSNDSVSATASKLADATRQSIRAKTAGVENVGLLLSGGMDSRVVLGAFDHTQPPTTLTVGEYENNEVAVARELAELIGSQHHFVKRNPTHYADILSTGTSLGGGMYSYQHGHFFDLELPAPTDLLVHGHGFDYMFQGMYLPSKRRSFLGRPTRSFQLVSSDSVVDEYLGSAKYMLKGIDPTELLRPNEITQAEESVRDSIETLAQVIQGDAVEPFDVWDYLTFGWPGRHYTYLNLISAGSLAPQQTIAWDNTVFDLFYATPARIRFGTNLLAETIQILRPELLNVRNANTNLSPSLSGTKLTLAGWNRGIKRRVGLNQSSYPSTRDRSWPTNDQILASSNSLLDRTKNLAASDGLIQLDLFDPNALNQLVTRFETGQRSLGSAILTLLTLDEFLSSTGPTGE